MGFPPRARAAAARKTRRTRCPRRRPALGVREGLCCLRSQRNKLPRREAASVLPQSRATRSRRTPRRRRSPQTRRPTGAALGSPSRRASEVASRGLRLPGRLLAPGDRGHRTGQGGALALRPARARAPCLISKNSPSAPGDRGKPLEEAAGLARRGPASRHLSRSSGSARRPRAPPTPFLPGFTGAAGAGSPRGTARSAAPGIPTSPVRRGRGQASPTPASLTNRRSPRSKLRGRPRVRPRRAAGLPGAQTEVQAELRPRGPPRSPTSRRCTRQNPRDVGPRSRGQRESELRDSGADLEVPRARWACRPRLLPPLRCAALHAGTRGPATGSPPLPAPLQPPQAAEPDPSADPRGPVTAQTKEHSNHRAALPPPSTGRWGGDRAAPRGAPWPGLLPLPRAAVLSAGDGHRFALWCWIRRCVCS